MLNRIYLLVFLFLTSCTQSETIYYLLAEVNPEEGGSVQPKTQSYPEGSTAVVVASASEEYEFVEWTGDVQNGEFDVVQGKNVFTVVMDSDKNVVANFVKKKYPLTIEVQGKGSVTEEVIKSGLATDYTSGTVLELTAIPEEEWEFKEWRDDVKSTGNPVQLTMDKPKTVTAVFVKKQYPLTIEIEGEGIVSEKVIKQGLATDYNSGTIVELTAEPTGDWDFVEWKGDITGSENPVQITIDEAKTVKAVFKKNPFYLDDNGVTIKARDWVTVGTTGELDGITYTAVNTNTLELKVLNGEDLSKVVTTLVTNLQGVGALIGDISYDIRSWDVSNVTNMSYFFRGKVNFNQDISNWDVSNVTNMSHMFYLAMNFNQDISNWDVSNVTKMDDMFNEASAFNQPIGNWDVSNVDDMERMFQYAESFNIDLSKWCVENVTSYSDFDLGAISWKLPKPKWGESCD